jgi:hypothetical protein
MNNFELIASEIIRHQKRLIGPVIFSYISNIKGLKAIDNGQVLVKISNSEKEVVNQLVQKCELLWGHLGINQCKDAAGRLVGLLNSADVPEKLK